MDYLAFTEKLNKNLFNIDSRTTLCSEYLKSCYNLCSDNLINFSPNELDVEQIWQIVNIQNINEELLGETSNLLQNSKYQSLYKVKTLSKNIEDNSNDENSEDGNEELSDQEMLKSDIDDELGNQAKDYQNIKKSKGKSSEVDDDFFKLSEMEAFLDQEEKQTNNKDSDINFFEDIPDDENNDEELNYKNFYGEDNIDIVEKNKEVEQTLSTFEVREERLKHQMKQLEDDIVAKKSWQLQGETNSKNRPLNSLLEEVLEFDSTSRAPLIITESTSEKLEDIIMNRIKNNLYDDVIKKVINKEKQEYSKQIVLDQEKSKESLSTIYEKQFNNQLEDNKSQEGNSKNSLLRSLMDNLFAKLDSLSNFHVTPQRLQEEPKIITNTLSLQVEEVAPVSVSDRNTLAPEEVKVKKAILLGNSEKTKSAKKKNRKIKAMKYKSKTLDNQKSTKVSKTESNPAIKTSTAFFSELQSNNVNNLKSKKKTSNVNSAKKMKL